MKGVILLFDSHAGIQYLKTYSINNFCHSVKDVYLSPINILHLTTVLSLIRFRNEGLIPSNYVTENTKSNLETYE